MNVAVGPGHCKVAIDTMPRHTVQLFKYDLSGGMARQMSQPMLGFQLEAVWHTSVCVYDREFYFDGGVGIVNNPPRSTRFGTPMEVVNLGTTDVEPQDFAAWIRDMGAKFGPADYALLGRNCNHFSNDALEFLIGHGVSEDVATMIDRIMATPLGQMLRPSLEAMTTAPPGTQGGPAFQPSAPTGAVSMLKAGDTEDASRAFEQQANGLINLLADADDPEGALAAMKLMTRVVSNILANPTEMRYGKLNTGGTAFSVLGKFPSATQLLKLLGFAADPADESMLVLGQGRGRRMEFELVGGLLDSASDVQSQLVEALRSSAVEGQEAAA